jgi:dTDP-4-dehydrorhamnose reductase
MSRRRYLVTGSKGQVVQSLVERGKVDDKIEIIASGRPMLDLAQPESLEAAISRVDPDLIVSAAAYTAVDQAETEEAQAMAVNADGPAALASIASARGIPLIHLSTDYVFDGSKQGPYLESDPVAPLGVYGRTKLEGERRILASSDNVVILRTAWVYSPFGRNFVKTMMGVAATRDRLNVVADQVGNPTSALDIADCVLAVAANLLESDDASLRGVFHMAGAGEVSWADLAEEIFRLSAASGGPSAEVERIPSSAYPTPARRPANSRLDCSRLQSAHGIRLPDWRQSTAEVVERLVRDQGNSSAS